MQRLGWLRHLYVQVLIAVAIGVLIGALWPQVGVALKPLADAFIAAIKMLVPVLIFCTVTVGLARMNDLAGLGRLGLKTILYFEVISTFALAIGLLVGIVVHPGSGLHIDPASLDPKIAAGYLDKAEHGQTLVEWFLALIPTTFFSALTEGSLLQVLVVALLGGLALSRMGERGEAVADVLERIGELFFAMVGLVVRAAPLGALGAMGFTIGKYGIASLLPLATLIACFYLTAIAFVVIVLGLVARASGFSIFRFLAYIREELLIVLGASSSEAALPQLMLKLQRLGASRAAVGLIVPTGYSFNLDGTNIYMTLAILFIAQATHTPISLGQGLVLMGVSMLTSKGASGVTGAGFITLVATLAVIPHFPIAAVALLVGIDRFMSECRALTNFIGNGVATLAIARWEGHLDRETLARELKAGA
ncbi:MAG: dicarboxylate/amino acid:cation symporter [Caulobacteraceae bacterium]|nr:dicarboxylate/amino acid:cation symporter [Caulobacteraceae bacterium]